MNPKIKGWLFMGIAIAIQLYTAALYRLELFSINFGLTLLMAAVATAPFYLIAYRNLGTFPAWLGLALGFAACYFGSGDAGTAILIYTLCSATPLAVTLFWPTHPRIRPLAMITLPVAGGLWIGGAFLYTKLHFGAYDLPAITRQISYRFGGVIDELEAFYEKIYTGRMPAQIPDLMDQLRELAPTIGFFGIMIVAYLLFGGFFISVWLADRSAPKRWLGSWADLIPGRGAALLYMGCYLVVMFLEEKAAENLIAVCQLFGFLFVFTALYVLLRILRRKNWNPFLRFLMIGGLFLLSFMTVGGALTSPYAILMLAGAMLASTPPLLHKLLK